MVSLVPYMGMSESNASKKPSDRGTEGEFAGWEGRMGRKMGDLDIATAEAAQKGK